MPFTKISELVGNHAMKRGVSAHAEAAMILEFFSSSTRDLFESSALTSVRPLYFKDSVLTVAVLSVAVAEELKMREQQIIEQINTKIGRRAVEHLRLLS